MTARTWCVTVNQDMDKFHAALTEPSEAITRRVRYAVWQWEEAPGTGRSHIQAYVELLAPTRIAGVKSLFGIPSLHLESRMGTPSQAREYCMKEDSRVPGKGPYEFGKWSGPAKGQGKRNDLSQAIELLKDGGVAAVAEHDPNAFIRYHRGFAQLAYQLAVTKYQSTYRDVAVYSFWGAPGTGKTQLSFELGKFAEETPYILAPPAVRSGALWFDGYQMQKILIIDEMNGTWMPWTFLMRLLDKYPLQLPVKGGHAWAAFSVVILTSNTNPDAWYPYYDQGMDKAALTRRLKASYECRKEETDKDLYYNVVDADGDTIIKEDLFREVYEHLAQQ